MIDILKNVPLNTKKVYIMCTTKTGCEVFVPVDSYSGTVIDKKKQQLREKLDRIDAANKIEHIPVPA